MHHGRISRQIARGLRVLRNRIAQADIPSSSLDETLNIATWNVREFGKKRRKKASIHYIAEIIGQFDIVAVVEVRDDVSDLQRVLSVLGPYWRVVFSDWNPDAAGNRERVAYVYDKRAVTFTGLAAEADPPRKKRKISDDPLRYEYLPKKITWWRSPYMASFRAGNFDFILITAHIRWGSSEAERVEPLRELAAWIDKRRREKHVVDKDIILMGDFNISSKRQATFKAITSKGLRLPGGLREPKDGFGANLDKSKRYDQILHYPTHESLYTGRGGVLDFYAGNHSPLFPDVSMTKTEFTYQLSDHLPLWVQLDTDNDDVLLDQILNPGQ